MAALTASTNSIRVTNGSSIAGFSFGEAGFADGYSTLVYSNTTSLTDAESALGVLVAELPESITITEAESALGTFFGLLADATTIDEAESALGTFFGVRAESSTITEAESAAQDFPVSETASTQTITDAQSVLRSIFAFLDEDTPITETESALGVFYGLLNELSVITDYQFGRGWFKINDNQTVTWVDVNDNQTNVWQPVINGASILITQWVNNSGSIVYWLNNTIDTVSWSGTPPQIWYQINNSQ
jgi:hypothetical protein